jgi:hypothetical protein
VSEGKLKGRHFSVDENNGLVPARQFPSSANVKVLRHPPSPAEDDQAVCLLGDGFRVGISSHLEPQVRGLRPQALCSVPLPRHRAPALPLSQGPRLAHAMSCWRGREVQ